MRRDTGLKHMNTDNATIQDWARAWPDPALTVDPTGHVNILNDSALAQFGGRPDPSAGAADLAALLRQRFPQAVLDTGAILGPAPVRIDLADGDATWELSCLPLRSASGVPAGWLVVVHDVSEARRTRRRLDDAVRLMTHDLRSPQVNLLTLMELHRVDGSSMSSQRMLEAVQYHAQSSLDLVDDFAAWVRAESKVLAPEAFDLAELVEDAAAAEWWPGDGGLPVKWSDEPRPVDCVADRRLVEQAIGTLWRDAIRRSRRGSAMAARIVDEGAAWSLQLAMPSSRPPTQGSAMRVARIQPDDGGALRTDPAFALVVTAARRHGGTLHVTFAPDEPWRATLTLAKITAAPSAASGG